MPSEISDIDSGETVIPIATVQAALSAAAALPTVPVGTAIPIGVQEGLLLVHDRLQVLTSTARTEFVGPYNDVFQKLVPCPSLTCLAAKQDGGACSGKTNPGAVCGRHRQAGVVGKLIGAGTVVSLCCVCTKKLDTAALSCVACNRAAHIGCVHSRVGLVLVGSHSNTNQTYVCEVCAACKELTDGRSDRFQK